MCLRPRPAAFSTGTDFVFSNLPLRRRLQPTTSQATARYLPETTIYIYALEASPSAEPASTKREVDNTHCLFGLPEVVGVGYQ